MTAADASPPNPDNARLYRRRFLWLLGLSIVCHLLLLVPWPGLDWPGSDAPAPTSSLTVTMVEPAPPEPETVPQQPPTPEPEQRQHLPRHNAEETDLRGTDFESPVEEQPVQGEEPAAQPKVEAAESSKPQLSRGQPDKPAAEAAQPPVTTARSNESAPRREPNAAKATSGMDTLSDRELSGVDAGNPTSELEKRRIQMVNRYLQRMQAQVDARFRRPLGARPYESGVIAFELDASGYLLSARLAESSGNSELDASALQAIRAVPRFDVPDSPMVAARYYRQLTFRYSGE
ncbi:cell envelope integrity protein TolA [Marinobacter bohaiensis]|uniref:cell envelope integrity protein TolA n=1 Tax=Marinobacter bohaiensis TaxID=2201898 RepID=UPI000DAC5C76|nr:TonB family protein [Marinobacter bohaiensis]